MTLLSLLGSLSERMAEKIKGLNKKIEDFVVKRLCCGLISCLRISHSCIKRFLRTAISYLDLVTDSMLLSAVVTVAFVSSSNINFTLFPSQIAILLLSSIIIPLLVSAIMVATRRPLVILDAYQWREFTTKKSKLPVFISRLVILLFFPIILAMIINADEEAKEKMKSLKRKSQKKGEEVDESILDECELLTQFINETRLAMLTFKRNEVSMELVVQLSIHLTMILLSLTDFPIESGLQTIFKDSSTG